VSKGNNTGDVLTKPLKRKGGRSFRKKKEKKKAKKKTKKKKEKKNTLSAEAREGGEGLFPKKWPLCSAVKVI